MLFSRTAVSLIALQILSFNFINLTEQPASETQMVATTSEELLQSKADYLNEHAQQKSQVIAQENYQQDLKEFEEDFPKFDSSTTQGKFLNEIAKDAVLIAHKNNIFPSVMIAQAALESSWGQSGLAQNFNNLMGTKGSSNGVKLKTTEFVGSSAVSSNEYFSIYDSFKHSLEDYGQLLKNGVTDNPTIYEQTWRDNAANYQEATASLVGVYATDPQYDNKLNATIESFNLAELDEIKIPEMKEVSVEEIQIELPTNVVEVGVGDTIESIAEENSISEDQLIEINNLDGKQLYVGDWLKLDKEADNINFI